MNRIVGCFVQRIRDSNSVSVDIRAVHSLKSVEICSSGCKKVAKKVVD